jgi:hypothetical protein
MGKKDRFNPNHFTVRKVFWFNARDDFEAKQKRIDIKAASDTKFGVRGRKAMMVRVLRRMKKQGFFTPDLTEEQP